MKKLKWIFLQFCAVILYIYMMFTMESNNVENNVDIYKADPLTFFIMMAVMMAATMLLAPKPKQPKKPLPIGIEQFDVPTAEEGRAIQVLFGKRFVASPNVVWYGHLRSTPVKG